MEAEIRPATVAYLSYLIFITIHVRTASHLLLIYARVTRLISHNIFALGAH